MSDVIGMVAACVIVVVMVCVIVDLIGSLISKMRTRHLYKDLCRLKEDAQEYSANEETPLGDTYYSSTFTLDPDFRLYTPKRRVHRRSSYRIPYPLRIKNKKHLNIFYFKP